MTEQVEQRICIKFCVKLDHSSMGTNYADDSEGHSYGQLVIGSFITTTCLLMHHVWCRDFSWNIKSPRWPLQPRFGALQLLAFHKTKITFEREEISDHWWDSGKYNRAADGNWENCVRSQGAYFEGDWGVIVQCFLYLQEMSLFFITHGWIPSGQTLCVPGLYPDPLKQTPEGKARKLAS